MPASRPKDALSAELVVTAHGSSWTVVFPARLTDDNCFARLISWASEHAGLHSRCCSSSPVSYQDNGDTVWVVSLSGPLR